MALLLLFSEAFGSLKVNKYYFEPLLPGGAPITLLRDRLPLLAIVNC